MLYLCVFLGVGRRAEVSTGVQLAVVNGVVAGAVKLIDLHLAHSAQHRGRSDQGVRSLIAKPRGRFHTRSTSE